ncbi:MAG: heme anaerobic degradation radical SAM methyltransferase ChuW/HutW [Pseudorhodobacter sp.]
MMQGTIRKQAVPETQDDCRTYFARISDTPLRDAFDDARRAHPPSQGASIPTEDLPAVWKRLLNTPRRKPGVAYVHIPFCENHCLFCGFYQNAWHEGAGAPYVTSLLAQLDRLSDRAVLQGPPLRALYLGGGTPTALSTRDIGRLIAALRNHLPLAPDCEITLEGRIWNFTEDKIAAAFAAGVNRISLGVQTFDETVRRAMGRKASRAEVIGRLERLVAADSGSIVVDLMYGLPRQSLQTWADDLRIVGQIGLDGVDLYGLNLIPGTPLLSAIEKGKLAPVTREKLGHFYAAGAEALEHAGWEPISTTHWRSPSLRERSVYNYEVKTGADCIAIGAGAGGALAGHGFRNTPVLDDYMERVANGGQLVKGMTKPLASAPVFNAIRAGMERGRLDPDRIAAMPSGQTALTRIAPILSQWTTAGLLRPHHRFHDLTLAGRFWQVQMTGRLLTCLAGIETFPNQPPDERSNP